MESRPGPRGPERGQPERVAPALAPATTGAPPPPPVPPPDPKKVVRMESRPAPRGPDRGPPDRVPPPPPPPTPRAGGGAVPAITAADRHRGVPADVCVEVAPEGEAD